MRYYVVRPTNARSVAACHEHGFGVLLSPLSVTSAGRVVDISGHVHPLPGLPYVFDNGAWACHQAGVEWEPGPLLRLAERLGLEYPGGYWREGLGRGWLALPDIVGGGQASLDRSLAFLEEHRGGFLSDQVAHWLLVVQDGMTVDQIRPVIERHHLGVFVGGSTEWKWRTVHDWAELAMDTGRYIHVGRVNTLRRTTLCRDLGVCSADGSSVTRFAVNAEKLSRGHDGKDRPLPPPGRAREFLPVALRQRIAEVEPRARHTIAERRFRLALGAVA